MNAVFFSLTGVSLLAFVALIIVGATRWNHAGGKVLAIVGGVLLFGLLAFVAIVGVLSWSAWAGHPM